MFQIEGINGEFYRIQNYEITPNSDCSCRRCRNYNVGCVVFDLGGILHNVTYFCRDCCYIEQSTEENTIRFDVMDIHKLLIHLGYVDKEEWISEIPKVEEL